jgi:hypothetical protein
MGTRDTGFFALSQNVNAGAKSFIYVEMAFLYVGNV